MIKGWDGVMGGSRFKNNVGEIFFASIYIYISHYVYIYTYLYLFIYIYVYIYTMLLS